MEVYMVSDTPRSSQVTIAEGAQKELVRMSPIFLNLKTKADKLKSPQMAE